VDLKDSQTNVEVLDIEKATSSEIYVLRIRKCKTWANCMKKKCPVHLLQYRNIQMDCLLNQKTCQMKYEEYCKSIKVVVS